MDIVILVRNIEKQSLEKLYENSRNPDFDPCLEATRGEKRQQLGKITRIQRRNCEILVRFYLVTFINFEKAFRSVLPCFDTFYFNLFSALAKLG